ncbi:MAG: 2-oxoacid:acceptor oxidoreductase family protein [Bacillota bacterium]
MWFWSSKKNEHKSYSGPPRKTVSVRMEAIGGQGANSAGKILAEAAVLGKGFTGNHFSSFGSEKRGSPVRSFVRFSPDKKVIRSASFIRKPDVLVVFHESLMETHPEIFEGVGLETDIVVNSSKAPRALNFPQSAVFGRVTTIDATDLALKYKCGLNAIMLGAMCSSVYEIEPEQVIQAMNHFFAQLSAEARQANLDGFMAGQEKVQQTYYRTDQSSEEVGHSVLPVMGYLNAPLGGLIANPGNTVLKDNSASRKGIVPKFLSEVCFHCGYCDMVCPDYCFVWKKDPTGKEPPKLQGIDYQYCKGCQKCVVACPVQALVPVLENEVPEEERQQHLFPEAQPQLVEERWRKTDWSKLIAELSPESRMLTIQTELLDPKSYIRPDFSAMDIKKKTEGGK